MSTAQQIVAARAALQGLLTSNLFRSNTIAVYLAGLPPDESIATLSRPQLEEIVVTLEGFMSSSVQYLMGMLTQFETGSAPENVLTHLEDILLAYLAFSPEFTLAEEHIRLLAECYEQKGRFVVAQSLLKFLSFPADGTVN